MTTMNRPRYYLDSPYYDRVTDRLRQGAPSNGRREFNLYQRIESLVPVPHLSNRPDQEPGKK